MKTFKLVSFSLNRKDRSWQEIPFVDSLIINQENDRRTWLIEVFIDQENLSPFLEFGPEETFPVEVIITARDNLPAHFVVSIKSLKTMGGYASVLMEGKLKPMQDQAFAILESLVQLGFSGEELLQEFQKRMFDLTRNPKNQ